MIRYSKFLKYENHWSETVVLISLQTFLATPFMFQKLLIDNERFLVLECHTTSLFHVSTTTRRADCSNAAQISNMSCIFRTMHQPIRPILYRFASRGTVSIFPVCLWTFVIRLLQNRGLPRGSDFDMRYVIFRRSVGHTFLIVFKHYCKASVCTTCMHSNLVEIPALYVYFHRHLF